MIALANVELSSSARIYNLSRQLQIVTFAFSVGSILISNPYTYIPALLALATQVSSWRCRHWAGQRHGHGEEGRMRGLLLDALGSTSEKIDLANWLNQISDKTRRSAHQNPSGADYFASKSPKGMQRLRDHLQENAFWGKCLYGATATRYTTWLIAIGVAITAAVLVAIPLTSDTQGIVLARILVAVLASGAFATQVSEISAWRSAESKIDALDRRLETLESLSEDELRSQRVEALFSVYGDYCVASATAPPIPSGVYQKNRERLNTLWEQRTVLSATP